MAESQEDKLYKAEYAKSGRASCKKCKENIAKDSLRMAIMVQVRVGDGLASRVAGCGRGVDILFRDVTHSRVLLNWGYACIT